MLTQEYVKSTFGEDFVLVWNRHNHTVLNTQTAWSYYVFKKFNALVPVPNFCAVYHSGSLKDKGIIFADDTLKEKFLNKYKYGSRVRESSVSALEEERARILCRLAYLNEMIELKKEA